jgi:hypothetical protein
MTPTDQEIERALRHLAPKPIQNETLILSASTITAALNTFNIHTTTFTDTDTDAGMASYAFNESRRYNVGKNNDSTYTLS